MKFLKKNETKTKKTHKVEMGTLYDINKNLVNQLEDLTDEDIKLRAEFLTHYIHDTNNQYYMLLCNERKDYTIFRRLTIGDEDSPGCELIEILLYECLPNRGGIKSIDLTDDKQAVEIWLVIDGKCFCYYFFPYDAAIIEC